MYLERADVFQFQPIRRFAEIAAELRNRTDVGSRRRRQITDGHVLDHATAQRAHCGHLETSCLGGGLQHPHPLRQEALHATSPFTPRQRLRSIVTESQFLRLGIKRPPSGKSSIRIFTRPEVAMIFVGGHRPRTACASLRPSIEPGICMSVKMTLVSGRPSKISMASPASAASSASNPASSIISTALMRSKSSSSTTRTAGRLGPGVLIDGLHSRQVTLDLIVPM